ncbi:hypothetical protein NYV35_25695 [Escherichia coli]|nr:hypothetical protein [Escherichia coli]
MKNAGEALVNGTIPKVQQPEEKLRSCEFWLATLTSTNSLPHG